MEINANLTRKEFLQATKYLSQVEVRLGKRADRDWLFNVIASALWIPVGVAVAAGFASGPPVGYFVLASVGCLVVLPKVWAKLQTRKWLAIPPMPKSLYGPKKYSITDAGLAVEWEGGKSLISWNSVQRVVEWDGLFLLVVDNVSAYIVPVRCFAEEEEKHEFLEKVNAKIAAENA